MDRVNSVEVRYSENNNIWRWRIGRFQSRKHFKSRLGAYISARKFINKMSEKRKAKPRPTPVLTLVK